MKTQRVSSYVMTITDANDESLLFLKRMVHNYNKLRKFGTPAKRVCVRPRLGSKSPFADEYKAWRQIDTKHYDGSIQRTYERIGRMDTQTVKMAHGVRYDVYVQNRY
jgi:hypothetical protein